MSENGKIIIENGNEKKEYSILVKFDIVKKNKSVVLYTDYSVDNENNLRIFSATYDNEGKLKPVVEKDELEIIDDYIKKLENDIKSGMKFYK